MSSEAAGVIRRAVLEETAVLNELTGRSALSWGYEPEFLDWEPEAITVTPEWITDYPVYVLEEAGRIVGYYQPPQMSLDKLFVDAGWIGTGRGKRLWLHAVATARELGVEVLILASDPNAAAFYRAMGAEWTGAETTSRPGWALQMFRFPIPPLAPCLDL